MPLQRCTQDGKSGFKWGREGKCYTGPGAKKKAIKQGLAIEGPESFKKKSKSELLDYEHTFSLSLEDEEDLQILNEIRKELDERT